jgi:hypothetical protein
VAYVHTHPDQHQWTQYPSGYSSPAAYHDVDLNPSNGMQPSDLKIANNYFDDHADPRYRNLTGYVAGRALNGVTVISRYKKGSATLWAEDNIYKYNPINDTWEKVLNAPW